MQIAEDRFDDAQTPAIQPGLGIVEPVFGNLHNHHLRRFTLRTRRKVDAQWKLFALVHNVQKLQGKAP